MKRWIWTISAAAGLIAVAVMIILVILFFLSWRRDAPITIGEVSVCPADEARIGEPVTFTVAAELPWHRRPIRVPDVTAGEGRQVVSCSSMELSRIRPGRWEWRCDIVLQATDFRSGAGSVARLFCTADRKGESKPMAVELPFPDVVSRNLAQEGEELSVAGAVGPTERKREGNWFCWAATAGLLIAVTGTLTAVLRGKGLRPVGAPPLPAWESAERAFQDLEDGLPMPPDAFFQALTDIVRRYIEARFAVPATELTTPEFMAVVRQGSWLDATQGEQLQSFLASADMVKFARADATLEQMTEALAAATRFVVDTRPDVQREGESP